jgi:O-antigen/teichoic acid export membrane protein
MRWGIVPVILAIVAAAVWLVPMTPADSPARWSAWGGVVVATVVAVWLYRRGSGVRIN